MFLILGLPRSRTAWLANFMTYDGIFCHHEGINGCRSVAEYKEKIGDDGDSGTGMLWLDIEKQFPDVKKVIIDADITRSIQFGKDAFGIDMTEDLTKAQERLNAIDGLHIAFDEINEKLRDIWEYLTDKPFNEKRAEMLKKFNIQVQNVYDIDIDAMIEFKEGELCRVG